jgi:hypothetical protein
MNSIDKPPAPDMTELIQRYEAPSGELTAASLPALRQALETQIRLLQALCGWNEADVTSLCSAPKSCGACAGLDPLTEAFSGIASGPGRRRFSSHVRGLEGLARVEHVCPGDQAIGGPRSPENGYVELELGFNGAGFDPVFGANIVRCRLLSDGVPVKVDADLGIAMDHRFFLDELDAQEPILRIKGSIQAAGESVPLEGNLRISALGGGDVAFAFDVPKTGSMVFSTGRSGSGVTASNGRFSCNLAQRSGQLECVDVRSGKIIR